jgi:probable F420-dependent oxidoreductase
MSGTDRLATRYGLFIGQTGVTWSELVERTLLAEELGFDHVWLVDHLMPTDPPLDRSIFEAWTSLAALAALTRRIRIGVLVSSNTFRHPVLLAKQAVTVDHVSGGRLILGIGTGWYEEEHRRYGIDFPEPAERVEQLAEALEVIRLLQSAEPVTYEGRHFRLDGAQSLPKPMQTPTIPTLIAAHRPRMLRLAARYADIWDTFPTTPGTATQRVGTTLAERVRAFEAACRDEGRDPGAIRRSTWVGGEALESEAAYRAFVAEHRDLGFTDLMCSLPGRGGWGVARRVGTEVLPALREAEPNARSAPAAEAVGVS